MRSPQVQIPILQPRKQWNGCAGRSIEAQRTRFSSATLNPQSSSSAAGRCGRSRVSTLLNDARSREQVIADSCFWWAKHNLKFVHHSKLIEVWFGERDQLQLLISPDVLVRSPGQLKGDCAIYTTVICAMLEALGLEWEIVTLATDPREPDIFGHVYPRAVFSDGRREALDASTSYGKYPGWQVPSSDILRIQVWDESGRPIQDRGSRYNGLHGYVRRRGLAQGEFDVAYENVPVDYSYLNAPVPGATTYTIPAKTSPDYSSVLAQLVKGGMTLAELNAIPEGTVVDPSGRIIRQTSGYPVPVGSSLSLTGGTGGSMLLIGGLVFAVVIVMAMAGKK